MKKDKNAMITNIDISNQPGNEYPNINIGRSIHALTTMVTIDANRTATINFTGSTSLFKKLILAFAIVINLIE